MISGSTGFVSFGSRRRQTCSPRRQKVVFSNLAFHHFLKGLFMGQVKPRRPGRVGSGQGVQPDTDRPDPTRPDSTRPDPTRPEILKNSSNRPVGRIMTREEQCFFFQFAMFSILPTVGLKMISFYAEKQQKISVYFLDCVFLKKKRYETTRIEPPVYSSIRPFHGMRLCSPMIQH